MAAVTEKGIAKEVTMLDDEMQSRYDEMYRETGLRVVLVTMVRIQTVHKWSKAERPRPSPFTRRTGRNF